MARRLFLVAAILAVAMGWASSDTHSDCSLAQTAFGMCVPYVTGDDPSLSTQCCSGLQSVKELTPKVEDRRAICACLLSLLSKVGHAIDSAKAAALPASCSITTDAIPTSLHFDCSKIA